MECECNYQDDPEAPEVAGLVVAGALEELGRGVLQGEAGRLQGGAPRWAEAGEPKVNDFEHRVLAIVREQHVLDGKENTITTVERIYSIGSTETAG